MIELGGERGSVWIGLGLMTAGVACNSDPPAVDTESSTSGQTSTTTTTETGTTTSTATSVTATSPTTTVAPQCVNYSDCGYCQYCYVGSCFPIPGCGYYYYGGCYGEDRYCSIGEVCQNDDCVEVPQIPVCERQTLELSAIPLQDKASAILLVDLDGDGNLDLVAAEPETGALEIALGDGMGGFAAAVTAMSGLVGDDQRLAAADLDLDGDPDLAVLRIAAVGELSLLFGQDAMFMPPTTYSIGELPTQIFAGPIDNDANPDVLVIEGATGNRLTIRPGDGMGGLGPEDSLNLPASLAAAGAGDFDDDGTIELAVPNAGAPEIKRIDHNGNVILTGEDLSGIGTTPYNAALVADLLAGTGPEIFATRRVNGLGMVSLWPVDASRTDEPTINVAMQGGAFAVATGDVDGDGRRDVVMLPDANGLRIRVLYFNADGPECVQDYMIDHWAAPARMAVADLDGDGKTDILAADLSSATATLLRAGP